MIVSPSFIFRGLPGAWMVRREIDDARMGPGSFAGTAAFALHAKDALLYEERGELALGDWRGPASRRWIYALEADKLAVRYPSTLAELHLFRFVATPGGGASAQHTHVCGADRYDARFEYRPDGAIALRYEVFGPAKSYRLSTFLQRA
jgi:hypothetical protein